MSPAELDIVRTKSLKCSVGRYIFAEIVIFHRKLCSWLRIRLSEFAGSTRYSFRPKCWFVVVKIAGRVLATVQPVQNFGLGFARAWSQPLPLSTIPFTSVASTAISTELAQVASV